MNESMNEQPLATAKTPDLPDRGANRENLRQIATRQRLLLLSILVYLVGNLSRFYLLEQLGLFAWATALAAGVAAAVCVVLLASKLYGVLVTAVLTVLCVLPLVGLIVLLIVNGKATSTLKENGIAVGFLGADPSTI